MTGPIHFHDGPCDQPAVVTGDVHDHTSYVVSYTWLSHGDLLTECFQKFHILLLRKAVIESLLSSLLNPLISPQGSVYFDVDASDQPAVLAGDVHDHPGDVVSHTRLSHRNIFLCNFQPLLILGVGAMNYVLQKVGYLRSNSDDSPGDTGDIDNVALGLDEGWRQQLGQQVHAPHVDPEHVVEDLHEYSAE
ncbi:hypothetical protein HW555_004818 [Spodoptera exigua]|uniref:Uncharacterized protein n=1 Tax=Spodoptera exigua TaxID=7107 RepID=A0A835L774_SPOEX|nr:hypothetical protein HW555_004818 [Spodoptera exigua]